jgi:hypothetical protein
MTPLPSLREVTRQLRELHEAWTHPHAGGEYVCLARDEQARRGYYGVMLWTSAGFGREYVPGDECPCASRFIAPERDEDQHLPYTEDPAGASCCTFDAVAAARRLLAAVRDGIAKPPEGR